jgi:WD40 repeat protein
LLGLENRGAFLPPALARAADEPQGKLVDPPGGTEAVAVDPAGSWLVTGGSDASVRLWSLKGDDPFGKSAFVLRGHGQPVGSLTISPDGRRLVTGDPSGTLRLWDLSAKDPAAASHALHTRPAKDLYGRESAWTFEVTGNSRWLITRSGAEPGTTRIWDLNADDPTAKSVALEATATVRFCPNHRWLVGGGDKAESVQVWDLNAEAPWRGNRTLPKPRGAAVDALSPDGRWLFARCRDAADRTKDQYLMWDLREARPTPRVLISHEWMSPPRAGGVSPDGRWLAVAFDVEPHGVDLWDLRGNDPASRHRVLRGHQNTVRTLVFSPNSRWLVSGADDITARVWDLQAPDPAATGRVLAVNVETAVVAPNSRWLATSDKLTARLWDLEAPDPAATGVRLRGSDKGLGAVLITADGRWLVTHGPDKTARCWDLRAVTRLIGRTP